MTGWTIVTSEAEWDDNERVNMEALAIFEAGVCECGFHSSLTADRANVFTFETQTCPVCRGAAKMSRLQSHADEEQDKALGDHPPPGAPRAADGRRLMVRQMSPLEAEARRAPRSVAQKSPRE